jgi:hypothetical protein
MDQISAPPLRSLRLCGEEPFFARRAWPWGSSDSLDSHPANIACLDFHPAEVYLRVRRLLN